MGLIFVDKHIDKHIVFVLTMSKDTPISIKDFLTTPNSDSLDPSCVSSKDAPTSTGTNLSMTACREPEEELSNELSNLSKDEFMELNSNPLTQRKRMRRSSSGSDSDTSDLPQKYITKFHLQKLVYLK